MSAKLSAPPRPNPISAVALLELLAERIVGAAEASPTFQEFPVSLAERAAGAGVRTRMLEFGGFAEPRKSRRCAQSGPSDQHCSSRLPHTHDNLRSKLNPPRVQRAATGAGSIGQPAAR